MMSSDVDGDTPTGAVGELNFAQGSSIANPPHRRLTAGVYVAVFIVHAIAVLVFVHLQRLDVGGGASTSGARQRGIAAFQVPGSAGTSGVSPPSVKKAPLAKLARPREEAPAAKPSTTESAGSGQAPGAAEVSAGMPGAPVRLRTNLGLIKKVNPVFPPSMEAARAEGTVVLDAVIHRDGTVGDIKILKSSAPAFEQAAIDAVKQWRYTPLPYDGIVTVTVHFTLPR